MAASEEIKSAMGKVKWTDKKYLPLDLPPVLQKMEREIPQLSKDLMRIFEDIRTKKIKVNASEIEKKVDAVYDAAVELMEKRMKVLADRMNALGAEKAKAKTDAEKSKIQSQGEECKNLRLVIDKWRRIHSNQQFQDLVLFAQRLLAGVVAHPSSRTRHLN